MTLLQHHAFNPWMDFERILGAAGDEGRWAPDFDIAVTDSAYVLAGDLPGLNQKDIEIRIEDGRLTVRAERKGADRREDASWHRLERPSGKFERSFRLPEDVNDAEVKARYENGVLQLTLPREEPADTSRLIPVS